MIHELAIDFGVEEIRVAVPGRGIVCRMPSSVADDVRTGAVAFVGDEAAQKAKESPSSYRVRYPFRGEWVLGERCAPLACELLTVARKRVYGDATDVRLLLSIPCGLSDEEEYAVAELGHSAGFAEVFLVYSPIAALVGGGCSLEETFLAVNVGSLFTDIVVVSGGNLVYRALHSASGRVFNEAIAKYVLSKEHLKLHYNEAERIKLAIGTVWSEEEPRSVTAVGTDARGAVNRIEISSSEMFTALEEPCAELLDAIHTAAVRVPLEAVPALVKTGILLYGGGAKLRGLTQMISGITGFRTTLAKHPEDAVAEGLSMILPTLPEKIAVPNVSAIACKTNSYLY